MVASILKKVTQTGNSTIGAIYRENNNSCRPDASFCKIGEAIALCVPERQNLSNMLI